MECCALLLLPFVVIIIIVGLFNVDYDIVLLLLAVVLYSLLRCCCSCCCCCINKTKLGPCSVLLLCSVSHLGGLALARVSEGEWVCVCMGIFIIGALAVGR